MKQKFQSFLNSMYNPQLESRKVDEELAKILTSLGKTAVVTICANKEGISKDGIMNEIQTTYGGLYMYKMEHLEKHTDYLEKNNIIKNDNNAYSLTRKGEFYLNIMRRAIDKSGILREDEPAQPTRL